MFKSFEDFIFESHIFEAEEKKKSKIHPDLDNLMANKWRLGIIKKAYNKKHDGAWEKHDEKESAEIDKYTEELRAKDSKITDAEVDKKVAAKRRELRNEFIKNIVSKDPDFKDEVTDYYAKQDRFEDLGNKLNNIGYKKFKKENAKEYEELLDLQANHMNPVQITQRPGGIMQITTSDMERGGDEGKPGYVHLPAEVGAEAFQRKMNTYIDKNGKPKGVIMDIRNNNGGQQEIAKAMTDYFVDSDDYNIESQKFNTSVRRFRDDPDGLQKALDHTGEAALNQYYENLSDDEKKKFWEESKKKGYFEVPNDRKNKVDSKYRLTGIPTVLQTSIKTFSAGEFATDTIKNLNPNVVHIGNNSGGGANQTYPGYGPGEENNKDKSSIEKAKIVANSFRYAYVDEKKGEAVYNKIMDDIKSGKITDKMSVDKLAEHTAKAAKDITKDAHIQVVNNDGNIMPMVPQIKSDRVVVDPKTRKPLKDKDGKLQFNGNWEQSGVGQSGTGPFIESDPNKATMDGLEFLYKKTGQTNLAKKLKDDPQAFGLKADGKDGVYDGDIEANQSWFVFGDPDARQVDQLEKSKETAKINANKKGGIASAMFSAQSEFSQNAGKEEIKNIEDFGSKKMFADIDPKFAQKLKNMPVIIAMPGGKKKKIQTETLMDFVPIDINDPEEQAMIKAQQMQYARINALRIKQKLKPLIEFSIWLKRKIELAKDNKDYQERIKKQANRAMKPVVKESYVSSFESFLAEEENNRVFEAIVAEYEYIMS